jgi:hypothetical protein
MKRILHLHRRTGISEGKERLNALACWATLLFKGIEVKKLRKRWPWASSGFYSIKRGFPGSFTPRLVALTN